MTKNCIVPFCRHRGKIPGIKYYQITSRRRKSWLKALGRNPNDEISEYSFVCSAHFPQEQIDAEGCISPFAVPSLNLRPSKSEREIAIGSIPKNSKWLSLSDTAIPTLNFSEIVSSEPSAFVFHSRDIESLTEPEESEIITIEVESSTPENIHEDIFLSEDVEEQMSPLVPASSFDSDEEPRSAASTPVSDASSLPLSEENDVFPNTSSTNLNIESSNINPLHYLKRLKREQEMVKYFKTKCKSAMRTSSRRKKKILNLKTAINDVKKKLKQLTDVSKPD